MSVLGKILAFLNILAAAAFAYVALLDHGKREQAAAAVREHDLARKGEPLQDEYVDGSLPRDRVVIDRADAQDSAALKARFQAAGAPGQPVAVQIDEVKRVQGELLKALNAAADSFASEAKDKVKALEEVLLPLAANGQQRADLLARINAVKGKDADAKALLEDAARRKMLAQLLLPLEEMHERGRRDLLLITIGDLSKPVNDLEHLLEARFDEALRPIAMSETTVEPKKDDKPKADTPTAAGLVFDVVGSKSAAFRVRYERSAKDKKVTVTLVDQAGKETGASASSVQLQLTNVEGHSPIELTKTGSSYSATDDEFGTDKVLAGAIDVTLSGKKEPERCLFIEREPMDQRQAIAYLLVAVSQATRPDGKPLLESLPDKRVEVVVGRDRYNRALETQAMLFRYIADRRFPTLDADRRDFIDEYQRELYLRIPYLIAAIKRHQAIKKHWDDQLEKHEAQLRDRKRFRDQIVEKLKDERKKANKALAELARYQELLFQAQEAGSGVAEDNQRKEKQIRTMEAGR
jgi:hypothetical protein